MKSTLVIIGMLLVTGHIHAQQSDTTQVDTVPTEEIKQQPSDTSVVTETPKPVDSTRTEQKQVSKPIGEQTKSTSENQPRIIYYQSGSNRDDNNYSRRHKSRYGNKQDIKTLAGSMNHSGGFGALSFRMTEFEDETMVLAGIRAGWIINRTLGIGFEGHGIIPTAQFNDIDPTQDVVALGGYGGMFLELILFSNQVVHLTFPASAGAGWLGYSTDWESSNYSGQPSTIVDEDIFWYVEPGANIELNVSRNFRLDFGVSKRFTQDLELINTGVNAFDQLNYYVTLKIGGF